MGQYAGGRVLVRSPLSQQSSANPVTVVVLQHWLSFAC